MQRELLTVKLRFDDWQATRNAPNHTGNAGKGRAVFESLRTVK